MAVAIPNPPVLGTSFTSFSATNPTAQQPGVNLDQEFNNTNRAVGALIAAVLASLNADGTLKSSAVQAAYAAGSASPSSGGTNIADAPSAASAVLSQAWAEYLPGALPADTLAQTGITGQHYSSRYWAAQAAGSANEADIAAGAAAISANTVALFSGGYPQAGAQASAVLSLTAFMLPADADATNAFKRAVLQAQALGNPSVGYSSPVVIDVPAGVFTISGAIAATLVGGTAIHLRGAGAGITIIRQTADADAFRITLGNYGPAYGLGGAFNVTGMSIVMVCPTASNTRTALSISTTGVSGNTGVPLVLDDLVITSPTPSIAQWGTGISLMAFANVAYLSRIYMVAGVVGLVINGNAQSYTTAIFGRDITLIGQATGLVLGEYLQGIQIDTLFTVNTPVAVQSAPTLPAGNNAYVFSNCYLYGKTIFHALEGATAQFQIRMLGCYFDGNVNGPGAVIDRHVSFINVPQVTMTSCTLNGASPPASTPIKGLYIENQSYDTIISNCTFGGYGSPGDGSTSAAVMFAANTAGITMFDNIIDYNTASIVDLGRDNLFVNTRISRCGSDGYFFWGTPTTVMRIPAIFGGPGIATVAPNSGVEVGSPTVANTPFFDFHSSGQMLPSGLPMDYDVRLTSAGGGGGANGNGTLIADAASVRLLRYVELPGLPTSPTGQPTGALWRDTSAGNVVKVVT